MIDVARLEWNNCRMRVIRYLVGPPIKAIVAFYSERVYSV